MPIKSASHISPNVFLEKSKRIKVKESRRQAANPGSHGKLLLKDVNMCATVITALTMI